MKHASRFPVAPAAAAILVFTVLISLPWLKKSPIDAARSIPVQHSGRVKCFDAFALQTLELISGRSRWDRKSATQTVLEAIADPADSRRRLWIRVDHPELARRVGLESGRHFFSADEIASGPAHI